MEDEGPSRSFRAFWALSAGVLFAVLAVLSVVGIALLCRNGEIFTWSIPFGGVALVAGAITGWRFPHAIRRATQLFGWLIP